ncbi:MAG: type II toxin-antitoxin system VapC family toxin [Solirubrobacterales bacterium]
MLDASVVLKWFQDEDEKNLKPALELRGRFQEGDLHVLAPPLIWLEILNVAARKWRWQEEELAELAVSLPDIGFETIEPELEAVAHWSSKGLTAYDAAYVTVAEGAGISLVTDDSQILARAPEVALSLAA